MLGVVNAECHLFSLQLILIIAWFIVRLSVFNAECYLC
jgi:hypothetical protein